MKYSLSMHYADPQDVIGIAKAAEESGFFAITVGDHVVHPVNIESDYPYKAVPGGPRSMDHEAPLLNPWVTAGSVVAATTKLHFMTSVYLLLLRHPLLSANAAATLAGISGNRFLFGVGIGWMREDFEALGIPQEDRGAHFDESLDIMDRAWKGISEAHKGRFYSFEAMGTNPVPPQPIPLYFGGHAEAAMRRAALRGSGWICPPRVDLMKEQVETMGRLREELGVADKPFEFVAMLKQPDLAVMEELAEVGVSHVIVSSPWRPDVATMAAGETKPDAVAGLGSKLHELTQKL
jgi:probable F420-dependent oxidoreductase